MSEHARRVAEQFTAALGKAELGQDLTSGRMGADALLPLFAGMVHQTAHTAFLPIVGGDMDHFDPTARPMSAVITLLNGSTITITLEASDG